MKSGIFIGTSNIVLPVPNKTHYPLEYQDKSRLGYYSSIFNSLEVNSSFYKLPMPRTVTRWATEVPAGFCFSFKLLRDVTHAKELHYDEVDIKRFFDAVNSVGKHKGCILVQFPKSIKVSLFQRLRNLLDEVYESANAAGWKLAIEFRDKSWYRDNVYQALEQYKAAIVVHDMPASATPLIDMEADVVYLRFHGERGDYRGSYSDEFLEEYSGYIGDWQAEGKTVYVYFNNSLGDAVKNAMTLSSYFN